KASSFLGFLCPFAFDGIILSPFSEKIISIFSEENPTFFQRKSRKNPREPHFSHFLPIKYILRHILTTSTPYGIIWL
ncbi:MAG: hypothetical protein IKT91_04290, partial [Clostridia bacterium]|nr:hypothetical protein [Clostridia bacterium]